MATADALATEVISNLDFQVRRAIAKGLAKVGKRLADAGKDIGDEARDAGRRRSMHDKIAQGMRTATVTAYRQNVLAKKIVPSYRQGDGRMSGGALLNALNSERMSFGTDRGIEFIDRAYLDDVAAHWYRLNFGALPDAGPGALPIPIRFGDNTVTVTLGGGPSRPFMVPDRPGAWAYWLRGQPRDAGGRFARGQGLHERAGPAGSEARAAFGGNDTRDAMLFLGNPRFRNIFAFQAIPARGIRGRHFLEAGVQHFAERITPAYDDHIRQSLSRAIKKHQGRVS